MSTETFTDDDLVIPHFEDELWRILAEAHEDRRSGTMRLTPAVDQLHRRKGRRLVLSGIGAAAAAATLVVALSLRDGDDTAPKPDESAAIPADLVAKIGAATAEANATMIVVQTTPSGGVTYESWADEASGSVRMVIRNAAGDVISDAHPATVPTNEPSDHEAVAFDYCARTYTEVDAIIDGAPNSSFTQFVQSGLDGGTLVPAGTEMVDGKELIRLEEKTPPTSETQIVHIVEEDGTTRTSIGEPPPVSEGVVWVDPETYRPVKYHDPGLGSDKVYEYFERTPEKLAEMSPPVPAGFTHVDRPLGGIPGMPAC